MRGDGGHFNESGSQPGIWKSGRGKGQKTPKGRQVCDQALQEVRTLLENRPRQRDLLIEYLHLIQDQYRYLGARHLRALAEEVRLSQAEVYEVGHRLIDEANVQKVLDFTKRSSVSVDIPPYINLQSYLDDGGYMSLRHYQAGQCIVDEVQPTISDSGLRGFGGAGFPAARKWSFIRAEQGPRLIAVNADEDEPGTFKNRYYLEHEPHYFLEGILIASWAVEAESVYTYLRDEYPASYQILTAEIQALEETKIVPEGHIHLRRGAGAYVCGEESAVASVVRRPLN